MKADSTRKQLLCSRLQDWKPFVQLWGLRTLWFTPNQQLVATKSWGAEEELTLMETTLATRILPHGVSRCPLHRAVTAQLLSRGRTAMPCFENPPKNPGKTTQLIVHPDRTCSSLQPSWHLSMRRNGEAHLADTNLCAGWPWVILGSKKKPELMANHPRGELFGRTLAGVIQSVFFHIFFLTWCPQVGHHGELALGLHRAVP